MLPLISVIVPVYNVEKYLDRCVESIVNQTYKNLEIILVDDGSPDNCPKMCDEWAKKDSRIKVIHKENGGVSSARNAALNIAKGEYIGFVDSDDVIERNMFKVLVMNALRYNSDICLCNNSHLDYTYSFIDYTKFPFQKYFNDDIIVSFLRDTLYDTRAIWNKLYSHDILCNVLFDESIKVGEDYLFNYNVFKKSNSIVIIEDILYNYVIHDDSVMRSVNYDVIMRWKVIKHILSELEKGSLNYDLCLNNYQKELFCCLKELLRSDVGFNINYYFEIVKEIRNYRKEFFRGTTSVLIKLYLIILLISPTAFIKIYKLARG